MISLSLFIPGILLVISSLIHERVYKQFEKLHKSLKNRFHKKFFELFDWKYKSSATADSADYRKLLEYFYKDDTYYCKLEENISGVYNTLPFEVHDVHLKLNDDEYVIGKFFKGLVLATKLNKKFSSETIVKQHKINLNKEIKKIKLEDIEFDKIFDVYSNDQIESRYLLTTSFMDRLLKYQHKCSKYDISIVFDNTINENYNLFVFINTNKDMFEFPLHKSILNKKLFYKILEELTDILEIIDTLKLEQNIGL